eukprot:gnl/MRDRNA2_/MRDRNA2_17678_c0_seq2.p1 gnl/MRDRNA2_/MRDRNA2_17678_c0~~gnl/MRDRNA2_/MRDRNA2_17678_c0_seq2.p1  ORF type:complete len:337 (+),score=56.74 gnl/MRDRNA2_/MRDRNA2_17678_c0_seq2:167-1177(+)
MTQAKHTAWQKAGDDEEVLEPVLPIIDPHHHMWYNHPTREYCKNYMMDELSDDLNCGHRILKTVYVQSSSAGWSRAEGCDSMKPVGESELAQGIAVMGESRMYGPACVCAGIIATANLMLGSDVEPVLREHMRVSRNFRGIRMLGGKAEQIPFADPGFRAGVQQLDKLGLVYECNGPETHPLDFNSVLGGIADVAGAFPSLTIVVDHCGGAVGPKCFDAEPTKKDDWQRCIKRLASCPNVVMKVGGLQMAVNGFHLALGEREKPVSSQELADLTLPLYGFVIRTFGASRCMFESNFPVDKQGVSYKVLWNTFKRIAGSLGLSNQEKAEIFYGTAAS